MLSVIVPAHNEEAWIGGCIESVLSQDVRPGDTGGLELVIVCNGCTDGTAEAARAHARSAEERGWRLVVLQLGKGGKPGALNAGDAVAQGATRVYLDADIVMDPSLLGKLHAALDTPEPRWASGRMQVVPPRSYVTRHYVALWRRLPFMSESGATGAGLFAVNAAGRARWADFPAIISDDTFVRLQFAENERVEVDAAYFWPAVEGFSALVRVRRRQDAGVRELRGIDPALFEREGKRPVTIADHLRLVVSTPVSYAVYVTVLLAARLDGLRRRTEWSRGR